MLWKVVDKALGVSLLSFIAAAALATGWSLFVPGQWEHLGERWLIVFMVVLLAASPAIARMRKQRLPWAYLVAAVAAFPAVIGVGYLLQAWHADVSYAVFAGFLPYLLVAYLVERRPQPDAA